MKDRIVLGTRGSKLALKQSLLVKESLEKYWPGLKIDLTVIKTTGDKITDVPLAKIGGKGLFVKEIEEALIKGEIDLAVHSMKDLPGDLPEGLKIGAVPPREDPRDVMVSYKYNSFRELSQGSIVGTSSLRRSVQIKIRRPDLRVEVLRGNLDTRLRKVKDGLYDAVILAAAGIHRMGWWDVITEYFDLKDFLPAIGQGALAVEIRSDDRDMELITASLHDEDTAYAVAAERAFLKELEGGCQVPIGGHCFVEKGRLCLVGMVAAIDGSKSVRDKLEGSLDEAERVGLELAQRILRSGGREILDAVYGKGE